MRYLPNLADLMGCFGFMLMTAGMTGSMRATFFSFFAYWSGWIVSRSHRKGK